MGIKSDGDSTSYYKLPEDAKELLDLIQYKGMSFSVGNVFKACYRLGEKYGNDRMYDLKKMKFFIEKEIEYEEKRTKSMDHLRELASVDPFEPRNADKWRLKND
jgi:hypothetical protein